MIDRATIERILDTIRIEEVIGDFVSLRRRGANYLGLCPFHQDKNPSMSVSPSKGIFKCFSCGKAGSAVSFIMEHEHLSYSEALKYLAKKYGIEIVEKEETAEEIANRLRNESLLAVSEYAQKYYEDLLWNSDGGRAIGLSYFKERKFTDETIRKFGLGYAIGNAAPFSADAQKKGYKNEYLVGTGLCIERDNGEVADRFYERVMFPIHSVSGRVIAFGGRTLRTDKTLAKYVNSPETEIYNKSRSLYGIYFAKGEIAKKDKCYLVEGYTDVISMHQAGITNVVASSGTSLTTEQIRLIKRFTDNITIIYDGDEAGIKASIRGIDLVLEAGMFVKVVLLPPEDDPDSFAKAHTKDEIEDYIAREECDFIGYKSELLSKDMNDPLRKTQLINDIITSIAVIQDPILRNEYVKKVCERFDQKAENILQKITQLRDKKKKWQQSGNEYAPSLAQKPEPEVVKPSELDITDTYMAPVERDLIYYIIKYGCYNIVYQRFSECDENERNRQGSPELVETTVLQYITSALEDDGLAFSNDLYREIYNQVVDFSANLNDNVSDQELNTFEKEIKNQDEAARQKGVGNQEEKKPSLRKIDIHQEKRKLLIKYNQRKVIRRFSSHENQSIAKGVLDVICEQHSVGLGKYKEWVEEETNYLGVSVPKTITLFRLRYTEKLCTQTSKDIATASKQGDLEHIKVLMNTLKQLNTVKIALTEELSNY